MHPYLIYIMTQQEAEQLQRQAQHSHLSYAVRGKTKGLLVLRVIRWLGWVPRARWWKPTIRV
jgi:hypothetical protein